MKNYRVVLEPDENQAEWWAGAPSILKINNSQFYLAARMREGDSPRGRRGYEIRLLASTDGRNFSKIHSIKRKDMPVQGFERPALVRVPETGKIRLYGCGEMKEGWRIWKLADVDKIEELDPSTFEPVLLPSNTDAHFMKDKTHHGTFVIQYKDPFIFHFKGSWHMFVIGFDRVERPYHFISSDGVQWSPAKTLIILESVGWHNYFTRPACVLPLAVGFLLIYEGSRVDWWDPTYNIATGLAYSPDLEHFIDLTPNAPILKSTTPSKYHTWRYSHWISTGEKVLVYFEAACPNRSNEIRVAEISINQF